MTRRGPASILAGCACIVMLVGTGGSTQSAAARRPIAVHALGATAARTQVDFSLLLRFDGRGLSRYVDAMYDPHSKLYRRALDAAHVGRRFGVSTRAIRRIRNRLQRARLHVVAVYPQRTAIRVRGSVGDVERFLRVSFRDFVTPAGIRYHAPRTRPTIPRTLRRVVKAVIGLSTQPRRAPVDVRGGALEPIDALIAYDILPLHRRKIDGRRETIAIASLSRLPKSGLDDLRRFDREFGIHGPRPRSVLVAGGTPDVDLELSLDIDVVRGIAPKAKIVVYEAPNTDQGEMTMFQKIGANRLGITMVTYSWGTCDHALDPAYRSGVENALATAAAAGVSVFVASGDAGAYDCQANDFSSDLLSVDFPSDSRDAISVGGTLLAVRTDGRYYRETGWEDPLSNGGGGGGANPVTRVPRWQASLTAARSGDGRRLVPDVAAAASPASPWWVFDSGGWNTVGGTSAAAPFWAASMLLVQQYAASRHIRGLCFVAPLLYGIARSPTGRAAFHDVTIGGNRHYGAGRGWDYATGLGSPNVYNLARATVRYLKRHGAGRRPCRAPR